MNQLQPATNRENLLIVIATDNKNTILKFPLLYGLVSLPREYWKRVHVMFWGASIKVVAEDKELQKRVEEVLKTGVEFSSCIVCCEEYGVVDRLQELGIVVNHTGELLTKALKEDSWSTLTI